jgi:hypothetical protein
MCGYQGWFGTPGDGQGLGWRHYYSQKIRKFQPGHAGIEFWPDMTELAPHERFDTPFRHAEGSVAQVFSSAVRDTVMYDLGSMKSANIPAIKEDWRFLVKAMGILKDPSYQHHNGKPVVSLWGIGFAGRDYGPKEVADLVDYLKNDPEVGGMTVKIGTSTHWRIGGRDADPFAKWEPVYKTADIISPWMVGRYRNAKQARIYATTHAKDDRAWCEANGKEFMPVVFPGFGWSNLKKGTDQNPDSFIDRDGGRFLWAQYDAHIREGGAKMIYQAMFDELDEGTHIFKSTNNPPVGESKFQTYGDLPTDHYLWLVGEASKRLRGELPSTPDIPERITKK